MELARSYLNLAGAHIQLETAVMLFGLILSRIAAALMLAPFIGGPSVPAQIKTGFSVIVAAVLFPSLIHTAGDVHLSAVVYFALLAKEALVGACIGFIAQTVFYGVQIAGILIDTQRGMNQITYLAPQLPGHVSALGNFKFQASIVLFLSIGGHLLFLRALAGSFISLPILVMPHLHAGTSALTDGIGRITAAAIAAGLQLSAPVILAVLLIDVSFGCIGKLASQIRIANDAHTAKAWIGLALFVLSAALLLGLLPGLFHRMLQAILQFVKMLA